MSEFVHFLWELLCSQLYNFTLTNAYEIVLALELCVFHIYFLERGLSGLKSDSICMLLVDGIC